MTTRLDERKWGGQNITRQQQRVIQTIQGSKVGGKKDIKKGLAIKLRSEPTGKKKNVKNIQNSGSAKKGEKQTARDFSELILKQNCFTNEMLEVRGRGCEKEEQAKN